MADLAAPVTEVAYTREEWGIERTLPNWNNGEPYIEWGGWAGHDGYRVDYTAENVWSLASGRPVYRRIRTVYREHRTEPERILPPSRTAADD